MKLPIRVELKSDDISCSFTIVDVEFDVTPAKGDPILFKYDGYNNGVATIVRYIYHVVGDGRGSIVCCSAVFNDTSELVAAFDMFEGSVKIVDIDNHGSRPPSYYPAYRIINKLWGSKVFKYDHDHPTALAELIRAACIVGGVDHGDKLNSAVELVHKLIIENKRWSVDNQFKLLDLMRKWDKETSFGAAAGSANIQTTVLVARRLFKDIKSVPSDKLPTCIVDNHDYKS